MRYYLIQILVLVILMLGVTSTQDIDHVDASTDFEYKFDHEFYQKIQDIIRDDQNKPHGASAEPRYHSVILVVSRGHEDTIDEITKDNKNALVKILESIGARDIYRAKSLSFVTASVPINEIPKLSSYDEIFKLGDGELPITPLVDQLRATVKATPRDLNPQVNGSGVVVAVVDTGINSIYLNDKVHERIYCPNGACWADNGLIMGNITYPIGILNSTTATHGTKVAQVIAASGMSSNNGIASGVTLLDAMIVYRSAPSGYKFIVNNNPSSSFAESLDWTVVQGADIASISVARPNLGCNFDVESTTLNLILNEVVDKGIISVNAAGNESNYNSVRDPACAHNVITVGGIDDRIDPISMFDYSSRGPSNNDAKILKPELVAPAFQIQVLDDSLNDSTSTGSGTSFAAPQVSAAAALMLEAEPNLSPIEVKALLLLGANWTGPIPCTSHQFEQNNPNDDCSYARQPVDFNAANNATSLSILNNVGFGILDVAQSVRFVIANNVISDHLYHNGPVSKNYTFNVTNTDPVKIILTWLVHPHGSIKDQITRIVSAPRADLDFTVRCDGGQTFSATSANQTNEFVVFKPNQTGTCTVTVTGTGLDTINKPVQNYALASTHTLTVPTNNPPSASSGSIIVGPGVPTMIPLYGSDLDDDSLSFRITDDPRQGTLSSVEFITKNHSQVLYTPNDNFAGQDTFQITPSDGKSRGTPQKITLIRETLPTNSQSSTPTNTDNVHKWHVANFSSSLYTVNHNETFIEPYSISSIYLRSVNLVGGLATITTLDGATYRIAIPYNTNRMIEFPSHVAIDTLEVSSKGIDEQAAQKISRGEPSLAQVIVGYVSAACPSTNTSSSCPVSRTTSYTSQPNAAIHDNTQHLDTTDTINISDNHTMKNITISVDISHTYIGDLVVALEPPNGIPIILHDRSGTDQDDIKRSYQIPDLLGTLSTGNWTLSVGDYILGDYGTLNSWSIDIEYFANVPPPHIPDISGIEKRLGDIYLVAIDPSQARVESTVKRYTMYPDHHDLYFPDKTKMTLDPPPSTDIFADCGSASVLKPRAYGQYEPPNAFNSVSAGFSFYDIDTPTPEDHPTSCTLQNAAKNRTITTDKTLRLTIYNQTGKEGFSYSPSTDTLVAEPLPVCTSHNLISGYLVGNTTACYHDDGTDVMIFTKVIKWYGTRDNSTIPSFYPPPHYFSDNRTSVVVFFVPLGADKGAVAPYGERVSDTGEYVGDIYIRNHTRIMPHGIFDSGIGKACHSVLTYDVGADKLPPNTKGAVAIGFIFENSPPCSTSIDDTSDKLLFDREIRVQLDGKAGKIPFFYSPRENINTAITIPACNSTNSNPNQTLKDNVEQCYDTYNGHLIIISKRIGFYGAADSVTP